MSLEFFFICVCVDLGEANTEHTVRVVHTGSLDYRSHVTYFNIILPVLVLVKDVFAAKRNMNYKVVEY